MRRNNRIVALVLANVCALGALGLGLDHHPASAGPPPVQPVLANLADEHNPTGLWLSWALRPSVLNARERINATTRLPEVLQGTPRQWQTNPTSIIQYGLQQWDYWRNGEGDGLAAARRAADWLVTSQQPDGRWLYEFSYEYEPGIEVRAPWASAIAQGEGIALLVRLYSATHDPGYLTAARRALGPFTVPASSGGVLSTIDGHPFYEELGISPPTHILNGFMGALLGVYDLAAVDPASDARRIFEDGMGTLNAELGAYDMGGKPGYDLMSPPHYNAPYDYAVADILASLNSVAPSPTIQRWFRHWYG